MKQFHSAALAAAVLVIVLGAGTSLAMTAGEAVQTRRLFFDQMTDALKYIANHWDDSASRSSLVQAATVIEHNARSLPQLFPAGSGPGGGLRTDASDAIWTNRSDFDRLANLLAEQAARLAKTTAATDSAQLKSEIKDVITTCKSCHRQYRN